MNMRNEETRWLALQSRGGLSGALSRFVAVGEVLFVLLGAIILARLVFRASGFVDSDAYLFGEGVVPDFRKAAIAESQWHLVRYGLIFLAVFVIGKIRRRRGRDSYGLTTGGHSLFSLIGFGVGVYAAMYIPPLALSVTDRFVDIGPGAPFWALMDEVAWDANFWLYMAVSSFFIVPFVEEIAARGYMLGRLRESFSPGGALIMIGLIFAAAHTQYHKADIYAAGSLLSLVWGSMIMGYAVYRTSSLIPAIVAHALVNIPLKPTFEYYAAAFILLFILIFRNRYKTHGAALWKILSSTRDWFSILFIGAATALMIATLQATSWSAYAWLAGFVILFIASLLTRSAWSEPMRKP